MTYHTHTDENGLLVKCYHKCRNVLMDYAFWIGTLIAFPLEHALYEKIWPFTIVKEFLGL
jgi:hypothetical protein